MGPVRTVRHECRSRARRRHTLLVERQRFTEWLAREEAALVAQPPGVGGITERAVLERQTGERAQVAHSLEKSAALGVERDDLWGR